MIDYLVNKVWLKFVQSYIILQLQLEIHVTHDKDLY